MKSRNVVGIGSHRATCLQTAQTALCALKGKRWRLLKAIFLVLLATVVAPQTASANAETYVEVKNGTAGDPNRYAFGATSVSDSLTFAGGNAAASANLATGTLKVGATAPVLQSTQAPYYAYGLAQISDSVTFSPGAQGIGYLDFHWDGTLPGFDGISSSTATLSTYIVQGDNTVIAPEFVLNNLSCAPYTLPSGSSCTSGTSIDQTGSIPFIIVPGTTYFQLALVAEPYDGGTANFLNTGLFDLRLPEGVTYTSSTGVFLADASTLVGTGGNVVPEPETLFPLGLVALALFVRCGRKKSQPRISKNSVWLLPNHHTFTLGASSTCGT